MRQFILACAAALLLAAAIVVVIAGPAIRAEQVLPTPQGQLGGPEPLATQAPPGQLPSPTPPPTPTPAPATPMAGIPNPADCRVEARPIEDLVILANSDLPPAPPSTDGGIAADPTTTEDVTATVHELIACLNAGDQLRAAALLTDDYLARLLAETGWQSSEVMSILAPLLPRLPERWMHLTSVTDVLVLPDGHTSTEVALFDPERFPLGGTTRHRFVFKKDADRWLVDAVQRD
jgi:hypothetical protein